MPSTLARPAAGREGARPRTSRRTRVPIGAIGRLRGRRGWSAAVDGSRASARARPRTRASGQRPRADAKRPRSPEPLVGRAATARARGADATRSPARRRRARATSRARGRRRSTTLRAAGLRGGRTRRFGAGISARASPRGQLRARPKSDAATRARAKTAARGASHRREVLPRRRLTRAFAEARFGGRGRARPRRRSRPDTPAAADAPCRARTAEAARARPFAADISKGGRVALEARAAIGRRRRRRRRRVGRSDDERVGAPPAPARSIAPRARGRGVDVPRERGVRGRRRREGAEAVRVAASALTRRTTCCSTLDAHAVPGRVEDAQSDAERTRRMSRWGKRIRAYKGAALTRAGAEAASGSRRGPGGSAARRARAGGRGRGAFAKARRRGSAGRVKEIDGPDAPRAVGTTSATATEGGVQRRLARAVA